MAMVYNVHAVDQLPRCNSGSEEFNSAEYDPRMQHPRGEFSQEAYSHFHIDSMVAEDCCDKIQRGTHSTSSIRDKDNRNRRRLSNERIDVFASSSLTADRISESRSAPSNSYSTVEPRNRNIHSIVTRPRNALVKKDDQIIYQAAWYHRLLPDSQQSHYYTSWWNQCKLEWNRSFWELAQNDETLLEVFLSFAAAKKAAIKGAKSSQGYYLHKGKALTLVRRAVSREHIQTHHS